jgi:light-regulated signal transduction histidine kinase (bacteriophytochrome)
MRQLISDLLTLARAGRAPLRVGAVDMKALVTEAYAQLAGSAAARFLCGALPNAWGDESLLRQVVANLLSNALKFTAKTPAPRIEVDGRISGGRTVYSVRDNGAGFDMRHSDRLFGVFQRLHSASEFEGTGVGLALTARIVQRHGGSVWAEGEPGRGAAFHFALPLPAPAREEAT